jgi:RHS repeat-associated protein
MSCLPLARLRPPVVLPSDAQASCGNTYFEHQDITGTERVRTDYTGATAVSYYSLPWGDGYSATTPEGQSNQDNLHFATLDQDAESGTSHATFRQASTTLGRWMSPDPYSGNYDATNPQSMNRYSYVLNNPLAYVDPDGTTGVCDGDGNNCYAPDDCSQGCVDQYGNIWYGGNGGPIYGGPPQQAEVGGGDCSMGNDACAFMYGNPVVGGEIPEQGLQGSGGIGGGRGAPNNCISPGVCKSKIDNMNLMEKGKTNYRDPLSICSTHTTVDNSTGATTSHVDLFNPGTSLPTMNGSIPLLPFHLLFDAFPDFVYNKTGFYPWPAGRTLCQ